MRCGTSHRCTHGLDSIESARSSTDCSAHRGLYPEGHGDPGVVAVEDPPEEILGDLRPQRPLLTTPGPQSFENEAQKRHGQEPEEVATRVP